MAIILITGPNIILFKYIELITIKSFSLTEFTDRIENKIKLELSSFFIVEFTAHRKYRI